MAWWWLSYAGEQFLGAVLVEARSPPEAMLVSKLLGCDPGGEVLGCEVPGHVGPPPAGYANRLLSKEELDAMQAIWTPDEPGLKTLGEYADEGDPVAIALVEGGVTS
jgi:hypothetical protein